LELTVHHSINTERSIPAKRNVHNVPLDDTLIVVVDEFLLPAAVVLALALGRAADALLEELEELPATVSTPEVYCWKVGKE